MAVDPSTLEAINEGRSDMVLNWGLGKDSWLVHADSGDMYFGSESGEFPS